MNEELEKKNEATEPEELPKEPTAAPEEKSRKEEKKEASKKEYARLHKEAESFQRELEKSRKELEELKEQAAAQNDRYLRMMAEYGFDVSYYQTEEQAAYMLLLQLGVGEYDDDAWAFTPTSDQIYVLDAEVFNVGGMYTEFLQGVQAIVDDAEFANVKEDLSGIDWEWDGSSMTDGHRVVAFTCNGTPYAIRLDSYGDWLNAEIIDFVNEALKAEGCRGQLHVISDGYDQMIFLIYGDEARAAALRAIIGTEPWEEPETEGFSLLDWLF